MFPQIITSNIANYVAKSLFKTNLQNDIIYHSLILLHKLSIFFIADKVA